MSEIFIENFLGWQEGMCTEFMKLTFITRCNRAFKADLYK